MVFFSRKKSLESQRLLNRPKKLFSRRRDEDTSSDLEKAKTGTKRAARLFGKQDGSGTPPATPSPTFHITVVTSPPSPAHQNAKDDDEISELTSSVKKNPETPSLYSSSLIHNESNFSPIPEATEAAPTELPVEEAMAGEPTAEKAKPLMSCSPDTTTDVVTKLLGMMDEACSPSDREAKNGDANASTAGFTESASTTATSRRNDLTTVMSSVFSGVLSRPSTTAGESTSSSGGELPSWGLAPSQTEDEDTQAPPDTHESIEESLQKSSGAEMAATTSDAAAATAPAAADANRNRDDHENFELVLGRQADEATSIRRRNWIQRAREFQEEKKEDEMIAARSARYRAVFGADPSDESPKRNILPSFVKRLSLTGKPVRRDGKPQLPLKPILVTPNASLRSLRPGLEMEESLRGVHYLEDEPELGEEITELELAARPAVVSPEIQKVQHGPVAIHESKRSRSWNQKLQNLMGGGNEEPATAEVELPLSSVPRTRSSPMRLLGFGGPMKPPKPTWKSAIDPTTGLPYYYHRMTRQTTWNKPKDFDTQQEQWQHYQQLKRNAGVTEQPASATLPKPEALSKEKRTMSKEKQKRIKERQPVDNHVDVAGILRKKSPRDFMPNVWQSKQKIVRLLTIMNPPNAESVEKLMKQYEGREDELLSALEELVDSQPFDEPMQTEGSMASSDVIEDLPSLPEVMPDESYNRIRTEATATSGFLSQKTEKTEKHRNTGPPDSTLLSQEQQAPLSTSTSFSSNIESHDDMAGEDPSTGKNNVQVDYQAINHPKLKAVRRDRELVVEEFTNSRLKKENYDVGSRSSNRRRANGKASKDEAESSYNGDNDETDDGETYGEDSISALSEAEGDFNRREHIELVRQRVVEEANETRLTPKAARVQPSEWKQSELDKFISENGWDAVASYVSRMKDSKDGTGSKVSAQTSGQRKETSKADPSTDSIGRPSVKVHHPPYAQRKFGARSQLQHSNIGDDSSWESESSYESDDYTETSYESDDEPSSLTEREHRKEFVC